MPKIAIITPILPFPPDSGTRIRIFNLIKIMASKGYRLFLLSFDQVSGIDAIPESYRGWFEDMVSVGTNALTEPTSTSGRLRNRLAGIPFASRPGLKRRLHETIEKWRPDFIQIEKTIGAAYLDLDAIRAMGIRTVLEEGGVHHISYQREASTQRVLVKKLLYRHRARRLKRFETSILSKVDAVAAVSSIEAERIQRMNSSPEVLLVPNGVEKGVLEMQIVPAGERDPSGFFCGHLSYRPNSHALEIIIEQIVPALKSAGHELKFYIAGGGATETMAGKARKTGCVHLLGYVPDIAACFRKYRIMFNPMHLGGGTRLKMLEAMAYGMACVATSVGMEGIDARHEEHGLVADNPGTLAGYLVNLIQDPERANRLGNAGRELVKKKYLWDDCARSLISYYESPH